MKPNLYNFTRKRFLGMVMVTQQKASWPGVNIIYIVSSALSVDGCASLVIGHSCDTARYRPDERRYTVWQNTRDVTLQTSVGQKCRTLRHKTFLRSGSQAFFCIITFRVKYLTFFAWLGQDINTKGVRVLDVLKKGTSHAGRGDCCGRQVSADGEHGLGFPSGSPRSNELISVGTRAATPVTLEKVHASLK